MFDIRNNTGVLDPTPYYDVLRMRDGNFYAKNNDRRNTVHDDNQTSSKDRRSFRVYVEKATA